MLAGFARFGAPDMVLRESDLPRDLSWLAASAGIRAPADLPDPEPFPDFLNDQELRGAAQKA